MKTTKQLLISLFFFLLCFGALAQNEEQDQMQQDENQEQAMQEQEEVVSEEEVEFIAQYEPTYSGSEVEEAVMTLGEMRNWDHSGDGKFDAAEFYVVLLRMWDRTDDGSINSTEWDYGTSKLLSNYNMDEYGDFSKWDEDGNNKLDVNEFARNIERTGLYNASSPQSQDQEGEQQQQQDNMQDEMASNQNQNQTPQQPIVIWERGGVIERFEIGEENVINLGDDAIQVE